MTGIIHRERGIADVKKRTLMIHRVFYVTVITLILLSLDYEAKSQDFDFYKIESPEGISFNFVTGITQAPNGLMWFTTKTGLYSYDGKTLTAYNPNPLNPNSLSSNSLESIFIDPTGYIWIGTLGHGLNGFDPKTERFTQYRYNSEDPAGLSNDTVTGIITDKRGNLWIGTHGGLDKYIPETGQFEHYRSDPDDPASLSNNQVRSLFVDKQGTLWIGTGSPYPDNGGAPGSGGLNRMNMETGEFTRFMHSPGDSTGLLNNKISAIYEDSKGDIWIGTARNGLHILDRQSGTVHRVPYDPGEPGKFAGPAITPETPFHSHITFIIEDISGNMWLGTNDSGIFYFPEGEKERFHFYLDDVTKYGFADNGAWSAFSSRDGVFWLGGTYGSIYRINPIQNKIPHFGTPSPVYDFYRTSQGDLWIATEEKVIVKEYRDGTAGQAEIDIAPGDEDDDFVQKILEDHQGKIWIGGNSGLNLWEGPGKPLVQFSHDPQNRKSLSNNAVITIYEDREQNLWVATLHGLNLMDKENGTFRHFYPNRADTSIIGLNISTSILHDKQGNLWVGLWNSRGVYILDPLENDNRSYLPGSSVIFLLEDSFGTIWAGTTSGLFRYEAETDVFLRFTGLSPMSSFYEAHAMVEDDRKYLWVSTNGALLRINPQRDEVSRLGKTYGIEGINFNWNSGYKDPNGNLYFGHETGYFMFDPEEFRQGPGSPEISFISFQLANQIVSNGDQSLEGENLLKDEEIRLRSDQNVFFIEYAIIDYSNPEENQLVYFLENFDNTWQKATTEGRTYYFNVPTGKYAFRVKAMNSYGVWSEKKINITVMPPWWHTWWAYGLYAIVFVLMIFGSDRFQRRRIKRKERQRALKKELAQAKEIEKAYTELKATQSQLIQAEKMASLGELTAGIAHEIQNPLNFVNNFSELSAELVEEMKQELAVGSQQSAVEISDDIKQNLEKILYHGKRADGIVKGMLQHSRMGSGQKELTDINELADEYLRLAYHGLRAKDKTFNADFKAALDDDLPKVKVMAQDIGRVLLNLINNAFYAVSERSKKGEKGFSPRVEVKTSQNGNQVEIRVIDNGGGVPEKVVEKIFQPFYTTKPTGEGTGLGLSLAYDIIKKGHGGELELENKPGEGAEFVIRLPVNGK